jgi:hypothetical protein
VFFRGKGYLCLGVAVFSSPGAFYGLLEHFFRPFREGSAWQVSPPDRQALAFHIWQIGLSDVEHPASDRFSRTATPVSLKVSFLQVLPGVPAETCRKVTCIDSS